MVATAGCPPAAMLPLRLCRLWPRSPPTRLFAEATRQRCLTGLSQVNFTFTAEDRIRDEGTATKVIQSGPSNYYELLGVHPGASPEQIKRAFFSKSKELHPDRDPGNPALHSRFVELSEAYQVLSREQSRRNYDHQLRWATPPKSPGTTAHPRSAHQTHSSSWTDPNAQYWAQFHGVRPQGPESRQQQHRHNQRVMGYCLLIMLAGMGLHYAAFSWSRCIVASWMKRIGSSQPSTMTHGPGPGPTEPGSSRSNSRGSSCSHHPGLPQAQG
ncbi:dnaJ homolog subfamily C member 4 isoform X3 [Rhinolophus sinicus]|uniref:dnaJ homolog subfamily C member 4 isoform X3 n=1 Tax=Rhinolophus sinicus TaxID=89399 RepID=UPI003D79822E